MTSIAAAAPRKVRISGVFIAVALFALVSSAAAQGFRQEVVVTAAAMPVELGTVTRTVTVITRQQIERLPARSIADVLRLAGSVDVRARGDRGAQTDFAIRGANFGQVLVLVDGVRLNDAQSGHHNGDIPVPLDAVQRIEVLHGTGSSLFGADAFGGTINIITRRDVAPASAVVEAGSFGLIAGRGQLGMARGGVRQVFAAAVDRSAGFMFERGFAMASASSRTSMGNRASLLVSHVRKDFGANGFYGNAPSHEWTSQTLLAIEGSAGTWRGWRVGTNLSYRTHGDRFLFDVRRPGIAENRHRTHAVLGSVRGSRGAGSRGSVAAGLEAGRDWIVSSNLGDHATDRLSAFSEWRVAVAARTQVDASLRMDRYTEFGTAWSPSIGLGWWAGSRVRLRGSVGRAFRVPTFTERYYQDPAHLARSAVGPETTWASEAGADVFVGEGWTASATLFGRADQNVIDWLRATTEERWRTYNIREVDTVGAEFTARRMLGDGAFVQLGYTALDVKAAAVTQLSKYVLDYAPQTLAASASLAITGELGIAPRLEIRRRARSSGTTNYAVLDLRLSRRVGIYELRLEGTNLGDTSYEEILGVPMPGRAVSVSLAVGR